MLFIYKFIFLFNFFYFILASDKQLQLYFEEVRDLSELPMDKLIKIKTNLASENELNDINFEDEIEDRTADDYPMAMPLKKIDRGMIVMSEHWSDKGKDTKISKIFQLAITTLAFLAFGGYLLALICSVIRRNTTPVTNPGNVFVFSNLESLNKIKRPKRQALFMDPMENEFTTDRLYRGMIMLSEGYTSYTQ